MARYCLEVRPNALIIHKLSCSCFDLGTLLGTGCLADLGEFSQLSLALDAITHEHPRAEPCHECCDVNVSMLPQLRRPAGLPAIVLQST